MDLNKETIDGKNKFHFMVRAVFQVDDDPTSQAGYNQNKTKKDPSFWMRKLLRSCRVCLSVSQKKHLAHLDAYIHTGKFNHVQPTKQRV